MREHDVTEAGQPIELEAQDKLCFNSFPSLYIQPYMYNN